MLVGSMASGLRLPAAAADLLASVLLLFLGLELLMVTFYVATMENSLPPAKMAVRRLVRGDLAAVFWLGVVVVGRLLPLVLMAASIVVPPASVAVLVLVGGYSLRYSVLSAGARALLPGETSPAAFVR
jgi:formate-dependent nitrite reductase membrane component NrfD